jgi:hypothetical protein
MKNYLRRKSIRLGSLIEDTQFKEQIIIIECTESQESYDYQGMIISGEHCGRKCSLSFPKHSEGWYEQYRLKVF